MTGSAAGPVIVTEGLGRDFGDRTALADVDLAIEPGEIFALLGPNGGGKTTLFRILTTLISPSRGTARVQGHDVSRSPHAVRRAIGVAFQTPSLDPVLSVRENLVHQGKLYGIRGARLDERIAELLRLFDLGDRAGDRADTLSGGLARRVDLAKALLHAPPVLLLDEPSTGLDPAARRDLFAALEKTRREYGTTCFLTTHLMDEGARCDRVAILDRGRLVVGGRPDDLVHAIGGEVITLVAPDAEALARDIGDRFGAPAICRNGSVRLERAGAGRLLPELLASFGERVDSVTLARPSLEDVFFHETGRAWSAEEGRSG